jgi:hypothetical protein
VVPEALPPHSAWYKPWAYGRWRGTYAPQVTCEAVQSDGDRPSS